MLFPASLPGIRPAVFFFLRSRPLARIPGAGCLLLLFPSRWDKIEMLTMNYPRKEVSS
jgi:hypothetical protein